MWKIARDRKDGMRKGIEKEKQKSEMKGKTLLLKQKLFYCDRIYAQLFTAWKY